jgi:hypothetical protein
MRRAKSYSLILAALLGIGILMVSVGSHPASADPAKDVTVVNTVAQPVPTLAQGTTMIAGSVGLDAGASVGIDPFHNTVKINSSIFFPVFVRDVDNPARHAFQVELDTLVPQGQGTASNSIMIPQDVHLVLEFASGNMITPPNGRMLVHIQTFVNGTVNSHFLVPTLQGPFGVNGDNFFVAAQPMRVYADPGTTLTLITNLLGVASDGQAAAAVTLSGYVLAQ